MLLLPVLNLLSVSVEWPCVDILYKWIHIICGLLRLIYIVAFISTSSFFISPYSLFSYTIHAFSFLFYSFIWLVNFRLLVAKEAQRILITFVQIPQMSTFYILYHSIYLPTLLCFWNVWDMMPPSPLNTPEYFFFYIHFPA